LNIETQNDLDEIRVATNRLLNEQKVSAARVVIVERFNRPVRLLSFDYYGNSDRAVELIRLNQEINVSFFDGDIKVLTDDNG